MSRTLTIPDQLYVRLAAEARSEGIPSVEEWLQKLVTNRPRRGARGPMSSGFDAAGNRATAIGHDLDDFIGDWSEAEALEFLGEVAVFEQIDESLWK